jgi:hypothetical protein
MEDIVKKLAGQFVERSEALFYKGKRRDDAAVEFFLGAYVALNVTGNSELANKVGLTTAALIAPRGYTAVEQLAKGE